MYKVFHCIIVDIIGSHKSSPNLHIHTYIHTSILKYLPTSSHLPLRCVHTHTHSLSKSVAGKLIGSIWCLGGNVPSQTPSTPPGIWRHQSGCGHQI